MNVSQNKKKPPVINSSILESLRDLSGGIGKTVTKDVTQGIANDAFGSIFGSPRPQSGDRLPQNEFGFSGDRRDPFRIHRPEAFRFPVQTQEHDLKAKIDAVRTELKALAASLNTLSADVEKAVQEVPVETGIYHLNFFEKLLTVLKLMRQQVDDSRTWLSMWSSRKKHRSYWRMYKKHGTTFGLSHERTLATQAG